jgi:hypothetical protein
VAGGVGDAVRPLASIPATEWRENVPFGLDAEREPAGSVPI